MNVELILLLMFVSLLAVMILGLPIAFATGGVGIVFALLLWGPPALMLGVLRVWELMGNFVLIAIPLFIFMANVLERIGIASELYDAIHEWMAGLKGGLAVATILACTIMAAMVGIIGAGIVTMGLIALPAMLKHRYQKGLALGSVCAGGSLGALIPPSVLFIMYGMIAGVSIGELFLGGVGPGLLLALSYCLYIVVRSHFQPSLAPALPKEERLPLWPKVILLKGLILPVLLILVVLGSVFGGLATPTEAAGLGSMGALLCALARRRLTWGLLKDTVIQTTTTTCLVMWTIFGTYVFVGVFTLAGGGAVVEELIMGLPYGRWGILIGMQIILLFLGMFVDFIGIIMLTMPLFVPIIVELGFCPLWFGILVNLNMQVAFSSPPIGLALFYIKGIAPVGISMIDIYRSVLPFIGIQIVALVLIIIFPQIGTWLPGLM